MFIAAMIFVLAVAAFIALVAYLSMRGNAAKKRGAPGKAPGAAIPSHAEAMRMAKDMPSGDAMYAMMFPDIAPLFQPEPLLEWLAWYQERRRTRQLIRDGRRWHGQVPGFAEAATMAVTAQGKEDNAPELVAMQKADGTLLVEFLVEYKADGRTLLTNNAGVFTLNPEDERKVRFNGADERSFAWRGPGLWQLSGNQAMPALQANGDDLRLARSGAGLGTGAAVVAGVAGVTATALMADRIMQEREAARAKRRAEREAQRRSGRGGGDSSSSLLDDYSDDDDSGDDDSYDSSTSISSTSSPASRDSFSGADAIAAAGLFGSMAGSATSAESGAAGNNNEGSAADASFGVSTSY